MNNPVKLGVMGAGHLGRIHIQQALQAEGVELVGFHDTDAERRAAITAEFEVMAYPDVASLIGTCEAVDIVTPTTTHHALALQAMEAGRHVFIEKPLSTDMAEARDIMDRARKAGVIVQVGHVERFNPAFTAARPHLKDPMFIETHRLAQFNPRGTDVSVVLDLMIHDIDIVLHTVGHPVKDVIASGVAVVSDTPDIANARIVFSNGCVANLTASRISLKNMRKSRFFQRDAYISVDMLEKRTEIVRMRTLEGEPDPFAITVDLGQGKGRREISFERPEVPATNAIRDELQAFARSVRSGHEPPVTAADGAAALEVALKVLACLDQPTGGPAY